MPHGDGTGPFGQGPMTGRAVGLCAGYEAAGYMNPMPLRGWGMGRGWGRGRGRGRGWRQGYYPMASSGATLASEVATDSSPLPAEQEVQLLKTRAEQLAGVLGELQRQIARLEASQEKEG